MEAKSLHISKIFNLKFLTTLSFILMVITAFLSFLIPIPTMTETKLTNLYPHVLVPEYFSYCFWVVIYISLLRFVIFQLSSDIFKFEKLLNNIRICFIFSCVLNMLCVYAWNSNNLLFTLIILLFLSVNIFYICNLTTNVHFKAKEALALRVPFSIYFGWTTVAFMGAFNIYLQGFGEYFLGFSQELWTIAILILGVIFATFMVAKNKDPHYGLTVIVAYGGILANHLSPALKGFNGQYYSVMLIIVTCMVLLLIASAISHLRVFK